MGMCICNDRRWPGDLSLHGSAGRRDHHARLQYAAAFSLPRRRSTVCRTSIIICSLQAGAYQNGTWVIGVAKAGVEDGCELIGQSVIVAPTGEIVAMTSTMGDEVIVAECDLDRAARARKARLELGIQPRTATLRHHCQWTRPARSGGGLNSLLPQSESHSAARIVATQCKGQIFFEIAAGITGPQKGTDATMHIAIVECA